MSTAVAVVGLGGAGCRIASKSAQGLVDTIPVIAVDTDATALGECDIAVKIQIGAARTNGLGCGGDSGRGRLAAEDDTTPLRDCFADRNIVIVVAGLGGGAATGAAPAILRVARESGALTMAFVTLPFPFEGDQRRSQAEHALRGVRQAADALIVVPNERLFDTVEESEVGPAFEAADSLLGSSVSGLVNILTRPGYIKLDFADLRSLVNLSEGTCALGHGQGDGKSRVKKAIESILDGPMLEKGARVEKAASLLVGIEGGSDLAVQEVGEIMKCLADRHREDCRVCMGTTINPSLRKQLVVTVIATEAWNIPDEETEHKPERADRRKGRRRKKGPVEEDQSTLELELGLGGKGRFKNVEPTVVDGQNLDVPTFIRLGVKFDK
jgi:cell division protein FtsZ